MLTRRAALLASAAALFAAPARLQAQGPGDVTLSEDDKTFTLSNGIVTARVSKVSGDLVSMVYKGTEVLYGGSGHPFAYWSHDTTGGVKTETKVTIDPKANGGRRVQVSVKGYSGGVKKMGHGPGAPADGDIFADIEIRYGLDAGQSGVYTWCTFDHPASYGTSTMAEARFCAKLAPWFSHLHVDDMRSGKYPLLNERTDKYVYTALQAINRAYGWTSPEKKLGFWFLITSPEYLSGGPTKPEFLCHGTSPTILSYWKSSHYMGSNVTMLAGEAWDRVVGPFMLYVNEGATSQAMWADAKAKLAAEEKQWPYGWAASKAFASSAQRGSVSGRLVLDDPLGPQPATFKGEVWVGLTKAPYDIPQGTGKRTITWQNDGKYCQFWTRAGRDGRFTIPHVPAGFYTLTAFADGVLGEFSQARVAAGPRDKVDLGRLVWKPVRRGRQIWEVGAPNRTATDYRYGDRYFEPGIPLRYAELFPNDVTFRPGVSDPAKDWFFAHVPHHVSGPAEIVDFSGVKGEGRATPWRILFPLKDALTGKATLRLAVCGMGARTNLTLSVNGRDAGKIALGPEDGVLVRHQIQGRWYEIEHPFDATLLKAGDNEMVLTVGAGSLNAGVVYDYLRLEAG